MNHPTHQPSPTVVTITQHCDFSGETFESESSMSEVSKDKVSSANSKVEVEVSSGTVGEADSGVSGVGVRSGVSGVGVGRVPRVSRLMALAVYLEELVKNGTVADYAELARLGYVSRARMTQIMNLRLLAPDIQEYLLFLPEVKEGRDPVSERDMRAICGEKDWAEQRKLWKNALKSLNNKH